MFTALGMTYLFYELGSRMQENVRTKHGREEVGEEPKMIDFRMNHGTKQLKEILSPADEEDDDSNDSEKRGAVLSARKV
jgi:hypothetical protein